MTDYIIPLLLAGVALFALGRRENVYEELLTGAAGGLKAPGLHCAGADRASDGGSHAPGVRGYGGSGQLPLPGLLVSGNSAGDCGTGSGAAHQRQRRSGSRGGQWPSMARTVPSGELRPSCWAVRRRPFIPSASTLAPPVCRTRYAVPAALFGRSHRLLHGFPHRPVVFLKFSLYFSPHLV